MNHSKTGQEIFLSKLKPSEEAFHDHAHSRASPCTPGTRTQILEDIEKWVLTSADQVYWMAGMAGTGKSTIAKSMCEKLEENEMLAGAFFCSRQVEACHDYVKIIPTIASQLAYYSCTFAENLAMELESDPQLATKVIKKQMGLLVKPWKAAIQAKGLSAITPVIVIDALDECEGIQAVLESLIQAIEAGHIQKLKFIFTSRPEQFVDSYWGRSCSTSKIALHDIEEKLVQSDILVFLSDKLKNWMSIKEDEIQKLAGLSGKLFIFAATVVKWITEKKTLAQSRLRDALDLQHIPDKSQTKGVDDLYSIVVSNAIPPEGKASEEERLELLQILHTVVTVSHPVSHEVIAELSGWKTSEVQTFIADLGSVLYTAGPDEAIYTFHASFPDFLFTKERSESLYCNREQHHGFLSHKCFNVMNKGLKFNMIDHPSSFIPDKEVENIVEKINKIDKSLIYTCRNWGYHFRESTMNRGIITRVHNFMNEKVIYWVEVMSLLRVVKYEKEYSNTLGLCLDILISIEKVFWLKDVEWRYILTYLTDFSLST